MTKSPTEMLFVIDAQTKIVVKFPHFPPSRMIDDDHSIVLVHNGKNWELLQDQIACDGIDRLYLALKKLGAHELILDESVSLDIGYLWQEYLQEKFDHHSFVKVAGKHGLSKWIGLRYHLWENARTKVDSWLFEKDGSAYLELTPGYRWHFSNPKPGERFISYEEFIKNYKPFLTLEIPWKQVVVLEKETARLVELLGLNKE